MVRSPPDTARSQQTHRPDQGWETAHRPHESSRGSWTTAWASTLLVPCVLTACHQPDSARSYFDTAVLQVLEQRCGAAVCHGVAPGAEEAGDVIDWEQLFWAVDGRGRIVDPDEAYEAALRAINTVESPEFSTLLRKPLDVGFGGLPHYGRTAFAGPDDPAYVALRDWIAMEPVGGEDPMPLTEMERLFADTIQPALVEGTCLTANCHGAEAGATPYHLNPGVLGELGIEATRHNYRESLRMLSLDGYPMQSRLLRKSLPLATFGVVHKGTNMDFYTGNTTDGVDAIRQWACAERTLRTGFGCTDEEDAPISGLVYVRGPLAPGHAFEIDSFVPGTDIYWAEVTGAGMDLAAPRNLTGPLHEGPADVRDPAVSRDGTQMLFSMRTDAETGHHIYVMDLATGDAQQLTFSNAPLPGTGTATDRDPTWGSDGRIWFVSTRAGEIADGGDLLDADIYSLEPGGDVVRWTWTPHVERKLTFFDIGPHGGELAFSALRDVIPAQTRAHSFRFPPSLSSEYHQHFGVSPEEDLFFDTRELPDGRYLSVAGELDSVWEAGGLGVIDRNFGPEVETPEQAAESALPLYVPPLVMLREAVSGDVESVPVCRDPAPLPDGRFLAACVPEATDVSDENAAFIPHIEIFAIDEQSDGSGPTISSRRVLLAEPGVALFDPEPVSTRAPVELEAPAHLPSGENEHGVFYHQGFPMIDALLGNLAPVGSKEPRDDVRFVRLVEALPRTPEGRFPLEAAESWNHGAATSTGVGTHSPGRVLAELPLSDDGTFQARVPAGVPFRVQGLNAERMAVGTMHNRWYYVAPGQRLVQGLSTAGGLGRYNSSCAACHGAADGDGLRPLDLEDPDLLTTASLTLSRYERQNPYRPIAPTTVGPDTRIEVDFERDVQPILSARCARCHSGEDAEAGLRLGGTRTQWFNEAYEALLNSGGREPLVDYRDGSAYQSRLMEVLLGRELGAPAPLGLSQHPHPDGDDALGDEEILTIIRWIDLGATFEGLQMEEQ